MSRIQGVFKGLAARGRKALIPYVTAGDPYPEATAPMSSSSACRFRTRWPTGR